MPFALLISPPVESISHRAVPYPSSIGEIERVVSLTP